MSEVIELKVEVHSDPGDGDKKEEETAIEEATPQSSEGQAADEGNIGAIGKGLEIEKDESKSKETPVASSEIGAILKQRGEGESAKDGADSTSTDKGKEGEAGKENTEAKRSREQSSPPLIGTEEAGIGLEKNEDQKDSNEDEVTKQQPIS